MHACAPHDPFRQPLLIKSSPEHACCGCPILFPLIPNKHGLSTYVVTCVHKMCGEKKLNIASDLPHWRPRVCGPVNVLSWVVAPVSPVFEPKTNQKPSLRSRPSVSRAWTCTTVCALHTCIHAVEPSSVFMSTRHCKLIHLLCPSMILSSSPTHLPSPPC